MSHLNRAILPLANPFLLSLCCTAEHRQQSIFKTLEFFPLENYCTIENIITIVRFAYYYSTYLFADFLGLFITYIQARYFQYFKLWCLPRLVLPYCSTYIELHIAGIIRKLRWQPTFIFIIIKHYAPTRIIAGLFLTLLVLWADYNIMLY